MAGIGQALHHATVSRIPTGTGLVSRRGLIYSPAPNFFSSRLRRGGAIGLNRFDHAVEDQSHSH